MTATDRWSLIELYDQLKGDKAEDRAILKRTGEAFTSAVIDATDGYIRSVYNYKQSSKEGFHHAYYLSDPDRQAFDEGDALIVWLPKYASKKLLLDNRYAKLDKAETDELEKRILEQITLL